MATQTIRLSVSDGANQLISGHSSRRGAETAIDMDDAQHSRINSYLRRTTRFERSSQNLNDYDTPSSKCDFLALLTAVDELYSQPGHNIDMQQLDLVKKESVGSGAVFQASRIVQANVMPSATVANETVLKEVSVIIKGASIALFDPQGQLLKTRESEQAAESFIMEVRILSHAYLRAHPHVVRLEGFGWEYNVQHGPAPNLILESAYGTLDLFQQKNTQLPFETRRLICLDIANGLSALHTCGIIHGDVKMDNVLMFEDPISGRWLAKVADFSHSVFDTGEERYLPGGTQLYAAPEWKERLNTSDLLKTDVFSLGLIIGSVVVGYDIARKFIEHGDLRDRVAEWEEKKASDALKDYVAGLLYESDDSDIGARQENIYFVESQLEATIRHQPLKRDLGRCISIMKSYQSSFHEDRSKNLSAVIPATIIENLETNILSIPYQAMNNMSNVLKRQVFRSLQTLAINTSDHRSTSACFELCVCYISAFGTQVDQDQATHWLLEAAGRGDLWAQASVHSILSGISAPQLAENELIEEWLCNAACKGSLKALKDLRLRHSTSVFQALDGYRSLYPAYTDNAAMTSLNIKSLFAQACNQEFIGYTYSLSENEDTILHLAAQLGEIEIFSSPSLASAISHSTVDINIRNSYGDTPLLFAARSGNFESVKMIIKLGGDAKAVNSFGENSLHFLVCFDPSEIQEAAELLVSLGANVRQEAIGSTIHQNYATTPIVPGSPQVRAAIFNDVALLEILLRLDAQQYPQEVSPTVQQSRQSRVQEANLRKMLAWACRLCSTNIFNTLLNHQPSIFEQSRLNEMTFWVRSTKESLLSLTINGYVSAKAGFGFNFPERFVRYLNHGEQWLQNLTVLLLHFHTTGLTLIPGGEDRCAIDLAIRHGRADAVQCMLEFPWAPKNRFGIFGQPRRKSTTSNNQLSEDPALPFHPWKEAMVSSIALSINQGHLEIFQMLLRSRGGVALDEGIRFPVVHLVADYLRHKLARTALVLLGYQDVSYFFPGCQPIFYAPKLFRFLRRIRSHSRNFWSVSEGQLNYGLVYMAYIAKAKHYDLEFSNLLLNELHLRGIHNYKQWVVRDLLDHRCTHNWSSKPPLYYSAMRQWKDLSILLLKNGAAIRSETINRSEFYQDFKTLFLFQDGIFHSFPRLSWNAELEQTEYQKISILQLLLNEPADVATFRAIEHLLDVSQSVDLGAGLHPSSDQEINSLLKLTIPDEKNRSTAKYPKEKAVPFSEDSIKRVWHKLRRNYSNVAWRKSVFTYPASIYKAANAREYWILQELLEMGYSANGNTLHRLFGTPLDALRWQVDERAHSPFLTSTEVAARILKSQDCLRILSKRKACRAIIYCVEFQLFLTFFWYFLLVAVFILQYAYIKFVYQYNYNDIAWPGSWLLLLFFAWFEIWPGLCVFGVPAAFIFSVGLYFDKDFDIGSYRRDQQSGFFLLFPFMGTPHFFLPGIDEHMEGKIHCMYGLSWNFFKTWLFTSHRQNSPATNEALIEIEQGLTNSSQSTEQIGTNIEQLGIYGVSEEGEENADEEAVLERRLGWNRGLRASRRAREFIRNSFLPILWKPAVLLYAGINKVVEISVNMERRRLRVSNRHAEEAQGLLDNL